MCIVGLDFGRRVFGLQQSALPAEFGELAVQVVVNLLERGGGFELGFDFAAVLLELAQVGTSDKSSGRGGR